MNNTLFEKSCGAVVFTRTENYIKYLLVKSVEGIWGFPKGHMMVGESERQTALREIKEETDLDVRLIDGFRIIDEYLISPRGDKPAINKQVVYFLATFKDQMFTPQESEISEIVLTGFDTAISLFSFDGHRRVLTTANDFLLPHLNLLN